MSPIKEHKLLIVLCALVLACALELARAMESADWQESASSTTTRKAGERQGGLASGEQLAGATSTSPSPRPCAGVPPKRHPHDLHIEQLFEKARAVPKEIERLGETFHEAWDRLKELFPKRDGQQQLP